MKICRLRKKKKNNKKWVDKTSQRKQPSLLVPRHALGTFLVKRTQRRRARRDGCFRRVGHGMPLKVSLVSVNYSNPLPSNLVKTGGP